MLASILANKWIRAVLIIVVLAVIVWLAVIILNAIGAHFNVGGGVGSSGFNVNLGGAK